MYDLQCENLTKRFGAFTAVDGVSLEIPGGSFFSILGPSGCGKTTLMRMIAGFEDPSSGDIKIKGRSVLGSPPNKRNVKMVFQHLALFPMMNVGENIAYGLRCRGASKADITRKVGAVLERIGLPDVAQKQIHQLSGGQKQRIAIARCMVLEPDVLLLDEPLGALDLKLRERMKIELKLLQHQFDTTFLYITHDQSEALVMSDHVAVMNAGKFEQIGTPQELYHNPRTAFVAGFVGDSNRWHGKVNRISNGEAEIVTSGGDTIVANCGASALSPGDSAEIFVRPDCIAFGGVRRETQNTLTGTVDSLLFNGANSRALVRIDSRELIEVAINGVDRSSPIKPGDPAHLNWAFADTQCFPAKER
ncbi:ABC transporter ATP-binding protein [Microvirga brassicacearum]|uniref:ABC transporter ATP-binding protein n=1 Tax=Microvirga brassicacearum TaxID=2580413 RepID=A0A5N3PAU5_9HYPH|nr:ABC transporter ATP-binding protein [Microvirga brassicacearum]KAB0266868.1 ABC transporter ATP-binding protein [Microvirga brassicacearum]